MNQALLHDKVALVTAGAQGSGAAIVRALAAAGARVALTYHHSEQEARLLTAQIRQQGAKPSPCVPTHAIQRPACAPSPAR
ncbi:SDR family NAD(P)-dependent oxidoreductase [Edwardsiella tarda]